MIHTHGKFSSPRLFSQLSATWCAALTRTAHAGAAAANAQPHDHSPDAPRSCATPSTARSIIASGVPIVVVELHFSGRASKNVARGKILKETAKILKKRLCPRAASLAA